MQNQANCKVEQQGRSQRQSPTTAIAVQVQNQGAKWSRMFTSASAGAVLGQRLAAEYHEPSDFVGDFALAPAAVQVAPRAAMGNLRLPTPARLRARPSPTKKSNLYHEGGSGRKKEGNQEGSRGEAHKSDQEAVSELVWG